MKKSLIITLVLAIIVCLPAMSWARPHLSDQMGTDVDAPIDGGLSILIGAGAAFIAKNRFDKRKGNQPTQEK